MTVNLAFLSFFDICIIYLCVILSFPTDEDVNVASPSLHAVIVGFKVPFSLPNPEACQDSGLTCPLKAKGNYTYTTVLPVKAEYPKVSL